MKVLALLIAFFLLGCGAINMSDSSIPGKSKKYVLSRDIFVQNESGVGKIPKGTVLYETGREGEISSYFIFLNLKERDILKEVTDENGKENLVRPLDGYIE